MNPTSLVPPAGTPPSHRIAALAHPPVGRILLPHDDPCSGRGCGAMHLPTSYLPAPHHQAGRSCISGRGTYIHGHYIHEDDPSYVHPYIPAGNIPDGDLDSPSIFQHRIHRSALFRKSPIPHLPTIANAAHLLTTHRSRIVQRPPLPFVSPFQLPRANVPGPHVHTPPIDRPRRPITRPPKAGFSRDHLSPGRRAGRPRHSSAMRNLTLCRS